MITCRSRLSRENKAYKIKFQAFHVRQSQKNNQTGTRPCSAQTQLANKTLRKNQTTNCDQGHRLMTHGPGFSLWLPVCLWELNNWQLIWALALLTCKMWWQAKLDGSVGCVLEYLLLSWWHCFVFVASALPRRTVKCGPWMTEPSPGVWLFFLASGLAAIWAINHCKSMPPLWGGQNPLKPWAQINPLPPSYAALYYVTAMWKSTNM